MCRDLSSRLTSSFLLDHFPVILMSPRLLLDHPDLDLDAPIP